MPKQEQFNKGDIIRTALEIIRSNGIESLSVRSLSQRLGCSVAPIFHKFANMETLMLEVRKAAAKKVSAFLADSLNYMPAFKEFGLRLIRLSKEEPNLFHYMFLDRNGNVEEVNLVAEKCLRQTSATYGISDAEALLIYGQIWPFVCGLAQLSCKNPEIYPEKIVSAMLSNQFQALLMAVKSGCEFPDVEPHLIPEGERIYLRRWRQSDAASLYHLASDPELGPRAGWPAHKSEEESLDVIHKFFLNDTTWAIVLKESGEIVGCAGYHLPGASNIPLGHDEAEVGYWVARPYWNQGICTEALNIVIEHCAQSGVFKTLYGEHFTDNPASGRVMEKCGFTDTGQRRTCPGLSVGADKEVRVLKRLL